jgi:aromatic-L-amino-acid decarboxylase
MSTLGLDGYRELFERQLAIADLLRRRLVEAGWAIVNDTALPLVCFESGDGEKADAAIVSRVVASGEAWISSVKLRGRTALRACVTSFETTELDVDALMRALEAARSGVRG